MNNPIKIIHKYKNQNRKNQYNVLIFVGNILSENTNKVLKKIKDKNLYDSLIELNTRDIEILTSTYGEKWYEFFFINKHINYTFKIIKQTETKTNEIIKKYGKEWYNLHIDLYSTVSKIIYSYQTLYKYEKELKIKNKPKTTNQNIPEESFKYDTISNLNENDIVTQISNRIQLENDISKIMQKQNKLIIDNNSNELFNSSYNNSSNSIEELNNDSVYTSIEESNNDNIIINSDIKFDSEDVDISNIDEYNIEELEKISKEDVEYNKDVDNINKSLQQIIDKTDIEQSDEKISNIIKWDKSKDNNMYDDNLMNVYSKVYIYNQYISKDDTIKIIKNKICCGYEKSEHFNKSSPNFLPSRLYL